MRRDFQVFQKRNWSFNFLLSMKKKFSKIGRFGQILFKFENDPVLGQREKKCFFLSHACDVSTLVRKVRVWSLNPSILLIVKRRTRCGVILSVDWPHWQSPTMDQSSFRVNLFRLWAWNWTEIEPEFNYFPLHGKFRTWIQTQTQTRTWMWTPRTNSGLLYRESTCVYLP